MINLREASVLRMLNVLRTLMYKKMQKLLKRISLMNAWMSYMPSMTPTTMDL
jgi:hypothetical protein